MDSLLIGKYPSKFLSLEEGLWHIQVTLDSEHTMIFSGLDRDKVLVEAAYVVGQYDMALQMRDGNFPWPERVSND